MTAQFYGTSTVITGVILILAWIQSRAFYVRIKEGQVLIRHWFAADNEFSTQGLQVQIKVEDVFEWVALPDSRIDSNFSESKRISAFGNSSFP